MSETQMIDKLFAEISDQRAMYMWTVGIFITLILALVGVQWYVNTKQTKRIEENVLNNIQRVNQKRRNGLLNRIVDNIQNKLDYLSKLDNEDEDTIRFITTSISNEISIFYELTDTKDELNIYLNKIVNNIDELWNEVGEISNSNNMLWESFHLLYKGITFNAQWDAKYTETDEESKEQPTQDE